MLAAFPERADPRDALVARDGPAHLLGLPNGARVGTGARAAARSSRALRPDLEVLPLRGNVHDATRAARRGSLRRRDSRLRRSRPARSRRAHPRAHRDRSDAAGAGAGRARDRGARRRSARRRSRCVRAIPRARARSARSARSSPGSRATATCRSRPLPSRARTARCTCAAWSRASTARSVARAEASGADPASLGVAVADAVLAKGGATILAQLRGETAR